MCVMLWCVTVCVLGDQNLLLLSGDPPVVLSLSLFLVLVLVQQGLLLTSVSTGGVHVSVVPGSGPILPRAFPGGQGGHVHALHGRGTLSPGGGRPIMHLLVVPVTIMTCGRQV